MNLKNFEYINKDVPFLKKDLLFRASFAVLFFAVFLIQLVATLKNLVVSSLSVGNIISSIVVLTTCGLFCFLSILYMIKNLRIIEVVNTKGKCVSSVDVLVKIDKSSFIKLYSIVCDILTLLASIVLICSFTYTFLQATYYSSISFYLPLLITIVLTSYYAVFHIKNEIKTIQTVNQYNSIY